MKTTTAPARSVAGRSAGAARTEPAAPPAPTETEPAVDTASSTPDRILLAAERLFSERGIDGVSLREITSAAGVNSAAAHYHFGSKQAVLEELFALRARPIAERREQLLGALPVDRQGRPKLEDVLHAFLQPALDALSTADGRAFTMLRARMAFEREEVRREALGNAFNRSSQMALSALAKALPKLSRKELYWRFHFVLGSMVYTMAVPGRIESISGDGIDTSDPAAALAHLVRFAAAGPARALTAAAGSPMRYAVTGRELRGLRTELLDGVLTVGFDRAARRNAIDVETSADMSRLLEAVAVDATVRVVVLRGQGAGFCAGMDTADFADDTAHAGLDLRAARESANRWRTHGLTRLPQPVIAMVHGFCEGGAIAVVEGCDIAFAADDAVFTTADGRSFDGREAERDGLVTLAFPAGALEAETGTLARELAAKDALALRFTKTTLRHVVSMTWDAVLDYNTAKQVELKALQAGGTSARAVAVESFLAGKSKPGLGH